MLRCCTEAQALGALLLQWLETRHEPTIPPEYCEECCSTVDDGETGFLVPVNDPAAFSSAVQKLVSNSSLRQTMARKARAEAERWDWESSTEHLRNVNYVTALRNFHMRANPAQLLFGWGRDKAAKVWKQFAAQTVSFWTAHPSAV